MNTSTKIISLCNQNNKTGKNRNCINIGMGFYRLGKKTLLVDLDQDLNFSYKADEQINDLNKNGLNLFKRNTKPNEILIDHEEIKIIPSSPNLYGADMEFQQERDYKNFIKDGFKSLDGSDFISIDCPAGLGLRLLILL